MIIHWDGASVAEHAQGSLITPAVIDKNKRSGEERGKNSTELQQRPQTNLTPTPPLRPPPPLLLPLALHHHHPTVAAVQPAVREDSSILILPSKRDTLRRIDHGLLSAVINSDNSELNEKFYFSCQFLSYSVAFQLRPRAPV